METYSVRQVAKLQHKSESRIKKMLLDDKNKVSEKPYFPNAYRCECGHSYRIPKSDIKKNKRE